MRIFTQVFLILAVVLLLAGCSVSTQPDLMASMEYQSRQQLERSLFEDDQAVISNEAIKTILSSKIVLSEKGKLAILRFIERRRRFYWSEEFAQLDQKNMDDFTGKLRTSKRLADASFIPSMLTPKIMTVPYMRAAAARTQADLLLVYKTTTRTYEKYRFLGKKETRAYSTVEAVLIDIRTGIIPFTSVATESYFAKKTSKDLDFYETVAKAEQQAIGKALTKIAEDLVIFLDNVP